jgi:hypothetical protein
VTSPLDQVRWIDLPSTRDPRGVLTAVESGRDVPFEIRRVFFIHDIAAPRGGHAHRDTEQILVAVAGSFRATVFDGTRTEAHVMDDATRGLYLPAMVLVEMTDFSPGAVGLVLASTHYDKRRSIRSREEFLAALEAP